MPEVTGPLIVGISTRALFDLREEHSVFEEQGVEAYAALQREREQVVLPKGTGFDVVDRLLGLNPAEGPPLVQVVLISRNSPDLSLRAFHSIAEYGLGIKHGSFVSGRPAGPLVQAWSVDLFLSNEEGDVRMAADAGTAAARLHPPPERAALAPEDEVRIAFDGDAVLFDAASDEIYKAHGLDAFLAHERANAHVPMNRGPFGHFLRKLAAVRGQVMRDDGSSRVRLALVTARNAPAHERVVLTFREWGTPFDEAHFVGHHIKAPFVEAFGAHIFFDDQEKHVLGARGVAPAGHVPGPHAPDELIVPAAK
ncbi:MAG TPA: 5'-nucleotidase [Phenylobacterium sp.]|uniref:5'-nucleotidase n=1 Tax=Phenylobacterium sp. TaxID=1871053 RepID=UPI002B48B32C|nr:5'-nucleotidase [Phenylobacterium sp.]HKR87984.1 5'-nucleotidase [Phenylobacterium sp.]